MLAGAVSYLGHRRVTKSGAALYAYFGIFAIAGILMIRKLWLGQAGGMPADSLFLAAGYAFVLMWFVNHPSYVTSRIIELGLQGRYLFPVLLPLYGVLSYHLIEPWPARARPWMAGAVGLFYLYGDFPWFLGGRLGAIVAGKLILGPLWKRNLKALKRLVECSPAVGAS